MLISSKYRKILSVMIHPVLHISYDIDIEVVQAIKGKNKIDSN